MSALSANDVWAVGNSTNVATGYDQSLAEHWDGTAWSIVPTSNPGSFHNDLNGVIAVSTNDVWVVGAYTTDANGTTALAYAQHWNGTSWTGYTLQPVPLNLFAVTATSSSDVWAVGTYYSAGYLPLVEHWNGTSWSAVFPTYPSPTDNELFAVSAWSSTDILAVGEETPSVLNAAPQSFAEHWNGTTWTVIITPNTAMGDNEILGVNALEAGHAVGVGFGNFINNGTTPRQSEGWDLLASGTSTNNASIGSGLGSGDNALIAVDRSAGSLWAVGYSRPTVAAPRQTLVIPATWESASHSLTWGSTPGTSASPGVTNSVLAAVAAVSPYAFWATGYENNATTYDQTLTESYCGRHFSLTAPASATAGTAFSLAVTALNGDGTPATGYPGTVHFTSSDTSATLPANYTFTPGDNGAHTFAGVVLSTPGNQTITAADIAMPFTMPGSVTVRVLCLGACPGPTGTPGARGANPGSAGTPGSRAANQSGAAVGGPRLPKLGALPQSADSAPGAALAAATGPAPQAIVEPPAVTQGNHLTTNTLKARAIQPRERAVVAGTTVAASSFQPSDNRSWLALTLMPLAVLSLALLWARRRDNWRLNG